MTRPGLYVHVPFCRRKCAYCDFVSYHYVLDIYREWCYLIAWGLALSAGEC